MFNPATRKRLHIRSIEEAVEKTPDAVPPDQEIGELFREMRQATGLSLPETAQKFNTRPETIERLEQGRLSALPSWNETSRVIVAYTGLLGLDSEPVLRRVMLQLPGDHPKRPRTEEIDPSYNNMRANADAIMQRVPGSQTPVENPSLSVSMQQQIPVGAPPHQTLPAGFTPEYAQMRAVPPATAPWNRKSHTPVVANKRKTGIFVPLVQFVLLLIILGTGYLMWLGVNDPQGLEELKLQALSIWKFLVERFQEMRRS